jgi:hypothetical protein
MGKNHKIKETFEVGRNFISIFPEESFLEQLVLEGDVLKFKMKSGASVYSTTITDTMKRELLAVAREGGSIGTFYNTRLRPLPITKSDSF